jgi:hypothetical protein
MYSFLIYDKDWSNTDILCRSVKGTGLRPIQKGEGIDIEHATVTQVTYGHNIEIMAKTP